MSEIAMCFPPGAACLPLQIVVFAPNQPLMGGGSCSHGAILEEHGSKGEVAAPDASTALQPQHAAGAVAAAAKA